MNILCDKDLTENEEKRNHKVLDSRHRPKGLEYQVTILIIFRPTLSRHFKVWVCLLQKVTENPFWELLHITSTNKDWRESFS